MKNTKLILYSLLYISVLFSSQALADYARDSIKIYNKLPYACHVIGTNSTYDKPMTVSKENFLDQTIISNSQHKKLKEKMISDFKGIIKIQCGEKLITFEFNVNGCSHSIKDFFSADMDGLPRDGRLSSKLIPPRDNDITATITDRNAYMFRGNVLSWTIHKVK